MSLRGSLCLHHGLLRLHAEAFAETGSRRRLASTATHFSAKDTQILGKEGRSVAVASAVLGLAFGAVLKTSVTHDLHLLFAPSILIDKLVGKCPSNNFVKKFKFHALSIDLFLHEALLRNWCNAVIRDARGAESQH